MKPILDFLALILFFVAYWLTRNIQTATAVAIVAGLFQAAFMWFRYKKLDAMQWLSLGLIVVFGGATLVFHDSAFIKWKPTVLYWLMAAVLMGGLILRKNPLKHALGKELHLPENVWRKLTLAWGIFLICLGLANLVVAFGIPAPTPQIQDERWAFFKVFGAMGCFVVFALAQGVYLSRHLPKD